MMLLGTWSLHCPHGSVGTYSNVAKDMNDAIVLGTWSMVMGTVPMDMIVHH
jgi:hypothetical protein